LRISICVPLTGAGFLLSRQTPWKPAAAVPRTINARRRWRRNVSPYSRWIFSLILNPISNQATKDAPEFAHERDRTPIRPLADDCLLTLRSSDAA
jgi:hypothetical protein